MIPSQTVRRKPREVAVARNPRAAFGDCQRGMLCVRDELSSGRDQPRQFQDPFQVIRTRDDHATLRSRADFLDRRDSDLGWSGRRVDPGVGKDSYEPDCEQRAKSNRLRSIHEVFEPAAMSRVSLSSARCAYTRRFTSGINKASHRPSDRKSSASAADARSAGSWASGAHPGQRSPSENALPPAPPMHECAGDFPAKRPR